jgi:SAM-dependent methyltransferase
MTQGDIQWAKIYQSIVDVPTEPRCSVKPFLEKYFPNVNGQTALDAGCGTGRNLTYLLSKGFKAFGFDFIPEAVEHTKEQLGIDLEEASRVVKVGDLRERFPFDGPFDLVVAYGCIHNIEARANQTAYQGIQNAFSEIARVLDGIAYVWVKSPKQLEVGHLGEVIEDPGVEGGGKTYRVESSGKENGLSWHIFTKPELYALVQQSGLDMMAEPKEVHSVSGRKAGIKDRWNWEIILKPQTHL